MGREYGSLLRLAGKEHGLKNMTLLSQTISPGKRTSLHAHPQEEIFHVVMGRAKFITASEGFQIAVGDTVIVFPGELHQIENTSLEEPCQTLIAVSPQK